MNQKLTDASLMPFGKYKGVQLIDVPASYLLWAFDQEWCRGSVKEYIAENLDVLKKENKKT